MLKTALSAAAFRRLAVARHTKSTIPDHHHDRDVATNPDLEKLSETMNKQFMSLNEQIVSLNNRMVSSILTLGVGLGGLMVALFGVGQQKVAAMIAGQDANIEA